MGSCDGCGRIGPIFRAILGPRSCLASELELDSSLGPRLFENRAKNPVPFGRSKTHAVL